MVWRKFFTLVCQWSSVRFCAIFVTPKRTLLPSSCHDDGGRIRDDLWHAKSDGFHSSPESSGPETSGPVEGGRVLFYENMARLFERGDEDGAHANHLHRR